MITLDEFREMKPGTVFYVAAPGRFGLDSNTLSKERFVKVLEFKTHDNTHLQTEGGGISFSYGKRGQSFFHTLEEAEGFMGQRHILRHKQGIMSREKQVEKLKQEISKMKADGPGAPDYIYHDRGN